MYNLKSGENPLRGKTIVDIWNLRAEVKQEVPYGHFILFVNNAVVFLHPRHHLRIVLALKFNVEDEYRTSFIFHHGQKIGLTLQYGLMLFRKSPQQFQIEV